MAPLSVAEALARVTEGLAPLEAERVDLKEASGRVLAEDVSALMTQPPFDASAMDGYAVRAADVAALPVTLKLVGESAAGAGYRGKLQSGEAVRIFTGAPIPEGANLVVIQENTETSPHSVTIKDIASRPHIRPRGQDFKKGDVPLTAGTTLGPRELTLAAAMNHADLPVRRRPVVAILATGNEVAPPGTELAADQIVSSVPYGLAAIVARHGGEALPLGIAKDDQKSIVTLAQTGKAADILVTIGGASIGEYDLVAGALQSAGLELDFWKIAMRPGKPLFFGRMKNQRVLGVPGNPVSALICAYVFLVPMLDKLLGARQEKHPEPEAILGEALPANGARAHYMRAVSDWRSDGARVVTPLPSQDSSLMAAFVRADCLIVRPPSAPALPAGARVAILPLERG